MKTAKQEVLEFIQALPDDIDTETIAAQLEFRLLVEGRIRSADAGELISHEEMKQRLAKWLTSPGL